MKLLEEIVGEINLIVLSMITRDSVSRLKKTPITLMDVLDSTLQVPYRSIILVDDSKDDTKHVVREWTSRHGLEIIIISSKQYGHPHPTRATARQTAIDIFFENFSDEWLMFMDDDVMLKEGWWKWIMENRIMEDPRVGEIWGINWHASPEKKKLLDLLGINYKDYLMKKFNERGGTHDTLYRRKAIEGVRIPPELHIYEDAYLHYWVKCNKWKSVVNPVGAIHYHPAETFTDIKREKERMKLAIHVATKYGICEYDIIKKMKASKKNRVLAYFSLMRPILGFALTLPIMIKAYGFNRGVKETFKQQYLKLWFRWQVLRITQEGIPEICEVIVQKNVGSENH